ncbi:hypothetical protein GA0061078_0289 [Bifidobacterium bohemicum]|uniref:Uncharacterized protein n=1 Tax=Bifidobacterium bohemicum DSM 22767 TaxID=1437606 RepID=A0A086ZJ46_9BIFI|nr:hypothetical protein BBOH_0015 [Bifidobacterium bohemicum DSM 22767]SCB74722.1 hypothetical protein GA0061078_0289 [Bifidobacterium bohemicum]
MYDYFIMVAPITTARWSNFIMITNLVARLMKNMKELMVA